MLFHGSFVKNVTSISFTPFITSEAVILSFLRSFGRGIMTP